MCIEDPFKKKVHLLRDDDGGGAYCGELCFGMGERGTYERLDATCDQCCRMLELEELTNKLAGPLDTFVRKVEEKRPGEA